MDLIENWQLWIIVGISLIILETFIPGFVIAGIGISCLASGLAAYLGMGCGVQGLILIAVTILFFVTIRPIFVKLLYGSSENTKTNIDALIGKTAQVINRIEPLSGKGRVLVNGEDWKGISDDTCAIENNETVKIIKVSGTKLIVKRKEGC